MKKKFSILLVVVLLFTFITTGCTKKTETKYCVSEIAYKSSELSADNIHFTEIIGEAICEELSAEKQAQTSALEKKLYDFLVETYDLDWKFVSTNVLTLDFSTVADGKYSNYAAMADPENHTVYLNSVLKGQDDMTYRLAHELIHCMRYYNECSVQFVLENEKKEIMGYYVGEAFTDIVAAKFLESIGKKNPIDYFLNSSGYCYTVTALQVLDFVIPGGDKMYLENNVEEYYQNLRELTEKHIEGADGTNYAEIFFYQADLTITTTNLYVSAQNLAELKSALSVFKESVIGNLEIALSACSGLERAEKEQAFECINYLIKVEGKISFIPKYVEHLKSCIN